MNLQKTSPLLPLVLFLASPLSASADDGGPTLRELDQEQVQVLQELVELETLRFEQGDGTWESVMTARRNLLHAKLEMATTPKARIALREAHLQSLEQYERLLRARVEQGEASRPMLLRARADRLRAQIELVKERRAD